ncbi:MAG: hypothetical protein HYX66_07210 [Ignavibacteria bacterium]|nr:hypothetical protein [Ignavibacteria bacterium]
MQKITLLLALFVITNSAFSQRPWIKSAWPNVGNVPKLALATSTLVAYDSALASSYNHGETWQIESEVKGTVRGVTDFPFMSAALAFTQQNKGDTVYGYFTQDGTNWTVFDSIDIGNRSFVSAGAEGSNILIATQSNVIIKVGFAGTTEIIGPGSGQNVISDMVSVAEGIVVQTWEGGFVSTDQGQSWRAITRDTNVGTGFALNELVDVGGSVYNTGSSGVLKLDFANASWKLVGKWDVSMGVPATTAVAGDLTVLIAFAQVGEQSQLFRLSTSDTLWVETAFPFPGGPAGFIPKSLIVDAGWAVTNQDHDAFAEHDSSGIYRYDLNDFTSVDLDPELAQIRILATPYGLRIENAPSLPAHINICNLLASTLEVRDISQGASNIGLAPNINGLLGVTLTLVDGRMVRRMIIR